VFRRIFLSLWLLTFGLSNALALSIHYGGTNSPMPFELVHQNVQSPLEIVLQLANTTDATASVLGWQLELKLNNVDGTQGTLQFFDVMGPPDPLFGETSDPQSNPELPPPTDSVFVQDIDGEFSGKPVPPHETRNILQLTLTASPDAAGTFELLMPNIEDPEVDSSWVDADDFSSKAFENSAPSSFPGFILLGTINILQPGDYDSDGDVDDADYNAWREAFGTAGGNLLADGNSDGVVNAADYVIWRHYANMGSGAGVNSSYKNVPEPPSFTLVCGGLMSGGLFLLRRTVVSEGARTTEFAGGTRRLLRHRSDC
jgi:hypothetical protein